MTQEMHHSSVPEELYNLTQLADVTLAAGKLSTTNLEQIKNYIRNEEHISSNLNYHHKEEFRPNIIVKETPCHSDGEIIDDKDNATPKDLKIFPKCKQSHSIVDEDQHRCASDSLYPSSLSSSITAIGSSYKTHSTIGRPAEHRQQQHPTLDQGILDYNSARVAIPPSAFMLDKQNHSLSSSEDDTIFNYSHKIFDKRKSRKLSYHSDDSDASIRKKHLNDSHRLNIYFGHRQHSRETDDSQFSSETDSYEYGDVGKVTVDNNGDDVHVCPECGKKYSTSSNLARHRQTHRSLMDKKARRCPHCDKVYVSMPAFSMHVRTHNQGCECPHCGKRFSRPWLLQGHIRTHTGEKPFQCSICAKAFADKSNLRAHVQTHSNTKPHTCNRCGKAFALKSYLYKHEESSCMRNQVKLPERDRVKYSRTDATKSTASSIVAKILRKGRTTLTAPNGSADGENAKKLKDKFAAHLNCAKVNGDMSGGIVGMATEKPERESIVMDYGSQKSYIDLTTNPTMSKLEFENFSRISVIRSALSNSNSMGDNGASGYDGMHLGFYQEKPMDFSPKSKFQTNKLNGNFECSRNYAIVV